MPKQRRVGSGCSRRQFLRAAGTAGIAGLAGCSRGSGRPTVAILGPGSLQNALANGLGPALDVPVQVEAHGSATVARLIEAGQRDPDIVAVADVALFDGPLTPSWYATFASNALVVVYDPSSDGGQRVAAAGPENWYEPLADGAVTLGRTDPDQDPLGYRTLFTIELASRYYADASNLGERILRRDQMYPETGLLSQFETGAVDAAIAYRNMAVERGYEYIELPDPINLSNPRYADDWYSTASYTLPSGRTIRGDVISYGATIRHMSDAAVAAFDALTTGRYLADYGFLLREGFPAFSGAPPQPVRQATTAAGTDRRDESQPRRDRPQRDLTSDLDGMRVLR
jgi:molybdate/tungstate transport system substrate-binding protein